MLLKELAEYLLGSVGSVGRVAFKVTSHVKVATEGTSLRGQVGNGSCEEGLVGETVVKREQELSSPAVLELSHELDTHVLKIVSHVIVVREVDGIKERLDLRYSIQAREVASGLVIGLVVLEGKAEA